MIPVLYEGNETQFVTNGLGRLSDVISCTVEENLNGLYELTLTYPISGVHYADIEVDRLILAEPFDGGDAQPFRIYQISRALGGVVTISAEHISYLLAKIVAMPFQAASCAAALSGLKANAANNCPFTFSTTKSVTGAFILSEPQPIRSLLGGQEGSILDVYGKGEYEFDRWTVKLSTSRGSDQGVTLRYGKNITELVRDSDISNAYTGIVPYWANTDGELVVLPEKVVWSAHRNAFSHEIVKAVDFSGVWQDAPTVAQLRARAQAYVTANEGWTIADNIKVSFVALWQTEEYKDIAALERVHMGDTVTVIYAALGVEASAKVIRTVYDVLLERYTEIELGTAKNTLAKAIADPILEEVPTSSDMEQAIAHGTKLITGGLGGYVYLKPNASGQPEEILIMDDPDYKQAHKLWRFNKNGLGYSQNGYGGTYKQAWTIDGAFYTDWVTTGRMTATLIKTGVITGQTGTMRIDVDNGTITLGNKALRVTAANFKLDSNGNVTISGKLTAQADSQIGPWRVTDTSIWYGNSAFGSASGLYFGTAGLSLADKFKVSAAGALEATGAIISGKIQASSGYIGDASGFTIKSKKLYNGKTGLNDATHSGVYIGTDGISLGLPKGGSASGTGFKVTASGLVTLGGIRFYLSNGKEANYGLWAKNGGTHIGSGGPCDFNSEGKDVNYLRGGTWVYGGMNLNGGLELTGDLNFSTEHDYNINDVNEISASGKITCEQVIQTSDERAKEDITDLAGAEEFVESLHPVRYRFKGSERYHHGFIAQEAPPEIVTEGRDGMLGINYTDIIADLVSVVQRQKKRIDDLEARLARVEGLLEGDLK